MRLSEIPSRAAADLLLRAIAADRLPHALLFQGPEGIGKAAAAEALAAALLCRRGGGDSCEECPACRRVRDRRHPDYVRVERLPKREGRTTEGEDEEPEPEAGSGRVEDLRREIEVDQIRELTEHAGFAPREGPRRVFVIDPADRMNRAAQNALLKTLEEPVGSAVLVLVAARPFALLPTIRSRCLSVRFAPFPAEDLVADLRSAGMTPEEARMRAALAEGRPRLARDLDLPASLEARERILEILESLGGSPPRLEAIGPGARALAGDTEEQLAEGFRVAASLLRDAARASLGLDASALMNADLEPRLSAVGRVLGSTRCAELVRVADLLRRDLRLNLNRLLSAEAFLAAVAGGPLPG